MKFQKHVINFLILLKHVDVPARCASGLIFFFRSFGRFRVFLNINSQGSNMRSLLFSLSILSLCFAIKPNLPPAYSLMVPWGIRDAHLLAQSDGKDYYETRTDQGIFRRSFLFASNKTKYSWGGFIGFPGVCDFQKLNDTQFVVENILADLNKNGQLGLPCVHNFRPGTSWSSPRNNNAVSFRNEKNGGGRDWTLDVTESQYSFCLSSDGKSPYTLYSKEKGKTFAANFTVGVRIFFVYYFSNKNRDQTRRLLLCPGSAGMPRPMMEINIRLNCGHAFVIFYVHKFSHNYKFPASFSEFFLSVSQLHLRRNNTACHLDTSNMDGKEIADVFAAFIVLFIFLYIGYHMFMQCYRIGLRGIREWTDVHPITSLILCLILFASTYTWDPNFRNKIRFSSLNHPAAPLEHKSEVILKCHVSDRHSSVPFVRLFHVCWLPNLGFRFIFHC